MPQTKETQIRYDTLLSSFAAIAHEPGAVLLDSSYRFGDRGQYSFACRRPAIEVTVDDQTATIRTADGGKLSLPGSDGLELLQSLWRDSDWFSVGYITYEGSLPFVAPGISSMHCGMPAMRFLFCESFTQFDHLTGEMTAYGPDNVFPVDHSENDTGTTPNLRGWSASPVAATPRDDYLDAVATIKRHIREGDIYQANFTTRFDVESQDAPFEVYRRLRDLNPAPYSAYINFGDTQILSSSPERMFLQDGRSITTGPIKGTIARGDSAAEEAANRQTLLASEKDRAELLMIVDLARNDLGRIADIGSVRVDSLFRAEQYSSVIHLVGDISAELKPDATTADAIRALLPGGSITGAPKKRAVEIINELETTPRSVYTGCIGYVWRNRADFNIAIRTILHRDGCYHIHAGGGIVADSSPVAEYEEMMLKARNLLKAVGADRETITCRK